MDRSKYIILFSNFVGEGVAIINVGHIVIVNLSHRLVITSEQFI